METIQSDKLIELIKRFVDVSAHGTSGIQPSEFTKKYKGTQIHATLYKAYGGNSKYVNAPGLLFLDYKQKATNGIYPIILFDRKETVNNFRIAYGWSRKKMPEKTWNIPRKNGEFIIPKLQLSIKGMEDIDEKKEEIINCLNNIIEEYHEIFKGKNNTFAKIEAKGISKFPLNLVLFGPPGTGKTYNSVVKALEIIAQQDAETQKLIEEYNDKNSNKARSTYYQNRLIPRFNELKRLGQIGFITFHQNYSYEDFVEGIRPKLEDTSRDISYECKDGIFKVIANEALLSHINSSKETESFEEALSQFKEKYQIESEIATKQSKFKIVDFLDKSIRILPLEGKNVYSISYEPLKQAYLLNKQHRIKNPAALSAAIKGFKGLSSYYFAVLEELNKAKVREESLPIADVDSKKRILQSYYTGESKLRTDAKPYVLIIDEINRGNISKIFGELITLLEEDKRIGINKLSFDVELPYTREKFGVPDNLYIIGTMNTADKSIALVDVALRRRFVFEKMLPDETLIEDLKVRELFNKLNKMIEDEDHKIGHSYFLNKEMGDMKNLWEKQIMPLIKEYFYGDEEKIKEYDWKFE